MTLSESIEKSKYIYNLKDDWDGEGSVGYSFNTWEQSIKLLVTLHIPTVPEIFHGNNGGIDLLYETDQYKMLIRINKEVNYAPVYCTDNCMKLELDFDTKVDNNFNKILYEKLTQTNLNDIVKMEDLM